MLTAYCRCFRVNCQWPDDNLKLGFVVGEASMSRLTRRAATAAATLPIETQAGLSSKDLTIVRALDIFSVSLSFCFPSCYFPRSPSLPPSLFLFHPLFLPLPPSLRSFPPPSLSLFLAIPPSFPPSLSLSPSPSLPLSLSLPRSLHPSLPLPQPLSLPLRLSPFPPPSLSPFRFFSPVLRSDLCADTPVPRPATCLNSDLLVLRTA